MTPEESQKIVTACNNLSDDLKSVRKDRWDVLGILLPTLGMAVVTVLGWWVSSAFQDSQLELQKATLLEKYIPRLEEGGSARKVAILALARLGHKELALEMASVYGGDESADAITQLGANLQDKEEQDKYFKVYRSIIEAAPEIATVGNPSYSELEEYTVIRMVPEQRTRVVSNIVMVPEERTRTVTVIKSRQETRTREVRKIDSETGDPVFDDEGNPTYETKEYTVSVPYTEQKEQTYTVKVPVRKMRDMDYMVSRPVFETRERDVEVFVDNYSHTTETIKNLLETENFTNQQTLFERASAKLFVTRDQENALKRQIAWSTKKSSGGEKLVFHELPESLSLPSVIKQPILEEDYPSKRWQVYADYGDEVATETNFSAPPVPAPIIGENSQKEPDNP